MPGEHSGPATGGQGSSADINTHGSVIGTIVNFLRSKNLPDAAIAGILGNMQIESSFRTNALNGNEGAIGLIQWEGGRRSALQNYAAAHGSTETDLNMQLGYMWHELTSGYSGVLDHLRHATDATQAAAEFDAHYEVSAGTTRSARMGAAQRFASSGLQSGGDISGIPSGGGGFDASGGGGGGGGGGGNSQWGGADTKLTDADYRQAFDNLKGIFQAVPELKDLLGKATGKGWTIAEFQQHVEASNWWKHHSANARSFIAMQFSDPGEYEAELGTSKRTVQAMARKVGINLTPEQITALANRNLIGGWDSDSLHHAVSGVIDTSAGGGMSGEYANYYGQLQALYSNYGIPISEATLRNQARRAALTEGALIEGYKQNAIRTASGMYPSLAPQLASNVTVRDIADPYMQTMGNILEVNPNTLTLQDPTIKRALQGSITTQNGKTNTVTTPMYQFEETLRKDPRWQYTKNANETMTSSLLQIGQDFGFIGS